MSLWTRELRDGDLTQPMGLGDFYLQLGLHYDLPERPAVPLAERVRKPRSRWWLVSAAVLSVALAVSVRLAERPSVVDLHPEVWGSWSNNDPSYKERSIAISANQIVIGFSNEAPPVALAVTAVKRWQRGDSIEYDVQYRQNQGLSRLRFTYVEAAIPELHLSNPATVRWVRPIDVEGATPTGQDQPAGTGKAK